MKTIQLYPEKANTKLSGSMFKDKFVDRLFNSFIMDAHVEKACYGILTFDSEGRGSFNSIETNS